MPRLNATSSVERGFVSTRRPSISCWRTRPRSSGISPRATANSLLRKFDVLLYDLTSTYVEGAATDNPLLARGYSRAGNN
jgi:hypothetical protein